MNYIIYTGRAEDILPTLAGNSFDGVLCDPSYGLNTVNTDRVIACLTRWLAGEPYHPGGGGFMGKEWDAWVPGPEVWSQVYRVLKPGAHCLAFGGTRMQDFLTIALRLGGFDIRDTVMWVYGSGFPKSHDISKAIDRAAGAEREVIGNIRAGFGKRNGTTDAEGGIFHNSLPEELKKVCVTAPSTSAAIQWDGYGTALKPAWEPVIVSMKPCDGTFAENALKWGVAGINVDGGRVEAPEGKTSGGRGPSSGAIGWHPSSGYDEHKGRWPANVIHDGSDEVVGLFPERAAGGSRKNTQRGQIFVHGGEHESYADSGSAARFFYCAKASKAERDAGCEGMEEKPSYMVENGSKTSGKDGKRYDRHTVARNHHPTVKPLALTEYLAARILPPERETPRRLLVPFCGSGSEMIGALKAGWDEVVGIELDADYVAIAEARLAHWTGQGIQHPLFRTVEVQA